VGTLVALALLAADPSRVDEDAGNRFEHGVHIAIAAGGGVAFGSVGAHLELLVDHFAAFIGTGVDLHNSQPWTVAGGIRFFSGRGEGFLLSLNAARFTSTASTARPFNPYEFITYDYRYYSATLGYRIRVPPGLFMEFGAGVGWLRDLKHGNGTGDGFYAYDRRSVIPDADLAVGFEF